MKSLKTVVRGLPVQLVVSHEMSFSASMGLQHEPSDPYAVRAAFTVVGSDETAEWIIGRDLLADGLEGPTGEGDIRVWPAEEHDVYVLLNPPTGTALLKASAHEIKAFLQETEVVVPRGASPGTSTWTLCWRISPPKDEGTQPIRTERLGRSRVPPHRVLLARPL
ncbi:SsgA family sporulation/cell division regulator [Streptomyces sp. NPDC048415]|uniref:SsgA family sporulation/cell division regulator n=1 Tax=Streptomyces sp. NPDC048415 TaxID=3154822 RepID=UPI00342802B1